MPLLDDIKNVLTLAAFRPDPDDAGIAWSKRFSGRRSLLLNISRGRASWRSTDRRNRLQEAGDEDGEMPEISRSHAEEWRGLTDGGWCSVSLNNRFIISLESNLSRRENQAELLRTNPKSVLGAKFDRGKRYAVYHHPESASSILMAADDAFVKSAEESIRSSGLKAGRVCCGLFAMLETKLREIYESGAPEAKGDFMLIVTCEGSIAALVQQNGQWTDLRCRCGVGTESPEAMFQIVSPLAQKIRPGTTVMYLHDGIDPKITAEMMRLLEPSGCRDVTAPDQLWQVIGSN